VGGGVLRVEGREGHAAHLADHHGGEGPRHVGRQVGDPVLDQGVALVLALLHQVAALQHHPPALALGIAQPAQAILDAQAGGAGVVDGLIVGLDVGPLGQGLAVALEEVGHGGGQGLRISSAKAPAARSPRRWMRARPSARASSRARRDALRGPGRR
jgi:hypothetical protein